MSKQIIKLLIASTIISAPFVTVGRLPVATKAEETNTQVTVATPEVETVKEVKIEPVAYVPQPMRGTDRYVTVTHGDTLGSIASAFGTNYQYLANINGIGNPDLIFVGQSIKVSGTLTHVQFATGTSRSVVPGNGYSYGWCTWYVKTRRPDIGNHWGNAHQWLGSAQASGYSTGYYPRVGAIAWNGIQAYSPLGHVAYVESVSNGMVTVSETSAPQWNVRTYRTVPASSFVYIY